MRGLLAAAVLLFARAAGAAAPGNPSLQYFGYWPAGGENFGDFGFIDEISGHANLAWVNYGYLPFDAAQLGRRLARADALGMTSIVTIPSAWVLEEPEAHAEDWRRLADVVRPHVGRVVFFLADEPESFFGGDGARTKPILLAWIRTIKSSFGGASPDVWINWIVETVVDGREMIETDVMSFDQYRCFETCYGNISFPEQVRILERRFPRAKIVLIPQGYKDEEESPDVVVSLAPKYYEFAKSDRRVFGLLPFNYYSLPDGGLGKPLVGTRAIPELARAYKAIGSEITGRGAPRPAAPALTSAAPAQFTVGRATAVTLRGARFAPGAMVGYSGPSTGALRPDSVSADGTELTITASAATKPGVYQVVVRNPDGGVSGPAAVVALSAGALGP